MRVDSSSCGENGADLWSGRGPWTVQVSFRHDAWLARDVDCVVEDGSSSR